jgi:hypothetical protein
MMLLAAVLVGLLLVTACTNPTNGDPGTPGKDGAPGVGEDGKPGEDGEQGEQGEAGGTGPEGKPGLNAETVAANSLTKTLLKAYYDNGVDTVFVTRGTGSFPAETLAVPKNKTLVITENISLAGGTLINAVPGTLKVADGAVLTATSGILLTNTRDDTDNGARIVRGANSPPTAYETFPVGESLADGPVALLSSVDVGGPGGPTEAAFNAFVGVSSNRIYALGDFTSRVADPFDGLSITVFGTTTAYDEITLTANTVLEGKLAAGADDIEVTGLNFLSSAGSGILDTVSFTVIDASDLTTITLAALEGTGTLVLDGNLTDAVIGGGTGKIHATGTTLAFVGGSLVSFGNTGQTTFDADVSVATNGISFAGPVIFGEDLTLTAVPATFNKPASFVDGAVVTLTTAASIINLGPDGALALGADRISSEGGAVVLTPLANTILTFDETDGIIQGPSGTNNHSITVTSGNAVLGGKYTVSSLASNVGTVTVATGAELRVNGELILTGASSTNGALLKSDGTGAVVANGTRISGGANGWQVFDGAATGTVTIAGTGTITASSADAILTAVSGGTPTITVGAAKTFTIEAATKIDLNDVGTITLERKASSATLGGTLAFTAATSIVSSGSTNSASAGGTIVIADSEFPGLTIQTTGSTYYLLVDIKADAGAAPHHIRATTTTDDVDLSAATTAGQA